MKILDLITRYEEGTIENLKEFLAIRDYVPFAEKYELCASVLEASNNIDEKTGFVKVDHVQGRIIFNIALLTMYTNLEFAPDDEEVTSIDEYDMLCHHKLLKPILEFIDEEYGECEDMLRTMQADLIANNNSVVSVVGNLVGQLMNKIESFDFSQVDIDKYVEMLTKLTANKNN